MRRVLSVASECVPLVKTGGLADVVGALPGALGPHGWEMRTLIPGYRDVIEAIAGAEEAKGFTSLFGGRARILAARQGELDLLVLDAPHLFDRDGTPYLDPDGNDWPDNPERFAALSWAAAEIAREGIAGWRPEVVHCHDWQAGFVPYYLRNDPISTVITIHNIAFQGFAPADRIEALRLNPGDFTQDGFEFWGRPSALKAGLVWADKITTVSPNYASELTSPEYGMGLDGLLRQRQGDLVGILNGIDTGVWDPKTDPDVASYKTPKGKARAKRQLRKEFGLPEAPGPLAVAVSRLSDQKGLDLLLDAMPALLDRGGQVALLGSGDKGLEAAWRRAAERYDGVGVHIGYNEAMSHRMVAGGDAILVPSRFEPCGLTQLMGLRYGTIPVVARTGGLTDTVIDASPMALRAGVATGIQFSPVTAHALAGALIRLADLWEDRASWEKTQKNAMRCETGWDVSAGDYADLYAGLADGG